MTSIVRVSRLLLLGVWLGAAIFFGAAVAPAAFGVLRDANLVNANELAGSIVARLLAVIYTSGFAVGLFLLMTAYFSARSGRRLAVVGEMISAAIIIIMTSVSRWVIAARMSALRAAMQGHIDQVALNDPRRVAFDDLHGYSVVMMGVALLAGILAFVLIGSEFQRRSQN
jgi:hypothetical protein